MAVQDSINANMFRSAFDAMPSLIFVVDNDVRIQDYNATAGELLLGEKSTILKRRGGEVLHCLHSTDVPEGCGRAPFCKECVIRNSVVQAFQGNRIVRRRTRLELIQNEEKIEIFALISASPFRYQETPLVLLVVEDISEIAELQRMIPICCVCKKVRDDKESWLRVEAYFNNLWNVDFSHGFCPECYNIELARLDEYDETEQSPEQ